MTVTAQSVTKRNKCRANNTRINSVLGLGSLCLSSFPKPEETDQQKFPLTLAFSASSGLVQLTHTVDRELMFREYWYNSGTNEAMAAHLALVAGKAMAHRPIGDKEVVVDIGCNDGTLLGAYPPGAFRVGIEPAQNIWPKNANITIKDFFSAQAFSELNTKPASIVTSLAMFYDLEDPVGFAREVGSIMAQNGLWAIEMHYLPTMLRNNEIDAVCHEHLCYYSLRSLSCVLEKADLQIIDAELNDTNGGSMLVFVKKRGQLSEQAQELLKLENIDTLEQDLMDFAERVRENRDRLLALLTDFKRKGKRVWGYGASTKGNTLLQYCGIGPDVLPAIAERNPQKLGRVTVGTRIPIVSEEEMRKEQPDYLLLLPYHFVDAFKMREREYLAAGGKFILPVPSPTVMRDVL